MDFSFHENHWFSCSINKIDKTPLHCVNQGAKQRARARASSGLSGSSETGSETGLPGSLIPASPYLSHRNSVNWERTVRGKNRGTEAKRVGLGYIVTINE